MLFRCNANVLLTVANIESGFNTFFFFFNVRFSFHFYFPVSNHFLVSIIMIISREIALFGVTKQTFLINFNRHNRSKLIREQIHMIFDIQENREQIAIRIYYDGPEPMNEWSLCALSMHFFCF